MRGIFVFALVLLGSGTAQAAPGVSLLRQVSYTSYEQAGGTFIRQFDPARGILRSAKAEYSGRVTYLLTPGGPVKQAVPYAYKAGFYIYYGPHDFQMYVSGKEALAPYQGSYSLLATGAGSGAVPTANLAVLKGTGALKLNFSADQPNPPPPGVPLGSLQPSKLAGTVTVTYSYLLAPTLPKKLPNGGVVPKP